MIDIDYVPLRTDQSLDVAALELPGLAVGANSLETPARVHPEGGVCRVMLPLVWALGFANVPLLYGLAAASVPIVIHLLNRRKFREVPWAAMRFLLAAIRKNRRRIRIEQWLLLAIRTLMVLLVVTAMAKPFLETFRRGDRRAGGRTGCSCSTPR